MICLLAVKLFDIKFTAKHTIIVFNSLLLRKVHVLLINRITLATYQPAITAVYLYCEKRITIAIAILFRFQCCC